MVELVMCWTERAVWCFSGNPQGLNLDFYDMAVFARCYFLFRRFSFHEICPLRIMSWYFHFVWFSFHEIFFSCHFLFMPFSFHEIFFSSDLFFKRSFFQEIWVSEDILFMRSFYKDYFLWDFIFILIYLKNFWLS